MQKLTSRTLAVLSATLFTLGGSVGHAATFIYNRTISNTFGTSDPWSAGTNWNATPVSAADTTLTFGNGASLASFATIFTSNDLGGVFQLNRLNFTYAGPASGVAPSVTIFGNPLEFVSNGCCVTPVLDLNATGTIKPFLSIANDLLLPTTSTPVWQSVPGERSPASSVVAAA